MTPWEIHYFFFAFMFIFQGILPVVGFLILVSKFKIEKEFLTIIKLIIPMVGLIYFMLGQRASLPYPCNVLVLFYSFIMSLFLHFFQIRNPEKPTKVLGIFLMVSHLFSQYWEIPVFIAGHLNILGAKYLGSIDQLYLILVFYLAIKYANISIDGHVFLDLLTPLFFSTITLFLIPIGTPQMPIGYIVRSISCFFLGKVFIERSVL